MARPASIAELQDWIVSNPYNLSQEDHAILDMYPLENAKDWKKKEYKPFKDRVRSHYENQQNNTCCYCRLEINKGTDYSHIEHIIDKNNRPDFIIEPKNLVNACLRCNLEKKTQPVMITCPPVNQYPQNGIDFNIVHGHYDDYFDHIEIIGDSIYKAITPKGQSTIDICGLTREGLAEQREKVNMYQNDELVLDVLEIRDSDSPDEKIDELIEKLIGLRTND